MYGQNKFDHRLDIKGKLDKASGIPVQDASGIAPIGGYISPPWNGTSGANPGYTGAAELAAGGSDFADADPYSESATQLFPLGTTLFFGDRVFKYAQMDGAVTAGMLLQQKADIIANHSQMAATAQTAVTTSATSDISVEFAGDTDATENQYQDGYLWINDADGEGQSWRVKSHPAVDAGADVTAVITVYGKINFQIETTSQFTLCQNVYKDVVIAPVTETGAVVGVTNINMTDDYYGWIQVRGPKSCLAATTLVLGHQAVRNDTTTAGAVMANNGDDLVQHIGTVMTSTVVNAEYGLILLNIA